MVEHVQEVLRAVAAAPAPGTFSWALVLGDPAGVSLRVAPYSVGGTPQWALTTAGGQFMEGARGAKILVLAVVLVKDSDAGVRAEVRARMSDSPEVFLLGTTWTMLRHQSVSGPPRCVIFQLDGISPEDDAILNIPNNWGAPETYLPREGAVLSFGEHYRDPRANFSGATVGVCVRRVPGPGNPPQAARAPARPLTPPGPAPARGEQEPDMTQVRRNYQGARRPLAAPRDLRGGGAGQFLAGPKEQGDGAFTDRSVLGLAILAMALVCMAVYIRIRFRR